PKDHSNPVTSTAVLRGRVRRGAETPPPAGGGGRTPAPPPPSYRGGRGCEAVMAEAKLPPRKGAAQPPGLAPTRHHLVARAPPGPLPLRRPGPPGPHPDRPRRPRRLLADTEGHPGPPGGRRGVSPPPPGASRVALVSCSRRCCRRCLSLL